MAGCQYTVPVSVLHDAGLIGVESMTPIFQLQLSASDWLLTIIMAYLHLRSLAFRHHRTVSNLGA